MLSGEDIVCFALRRWDSPWKNNQQVMSCFAKGNRVLYVDPPRPFREAIGETLGRVERKPVLEHVIGGLHLYHGPRLLARWGRNHLVSRFFNWVTAPARLAHVRGLAAGMGFRAPILWIYDPMLAPAIGSFQEKLVLYYVIDNYAEYFSEDEGVWRSAITRDHVRMMKRADIVLTVSQSLYEQGLQHNRNTFLVPNGVNYDFFQEVMRSEGVPPDMREIPKPIIGYVGVVHSVIDFSLLERVASGRREWSLMLVGPAESMTVEDRRAFKRLVGFPNVYYLGSKHPEELPGYIKNFDVALMPYRIGPLTSGGDSIKLYEYLACGRPVVSTPLPSARRFGSLIEIAESAAEFVECIERGLRESPDRCRARMAVAQEHSWQRRVEVISGIVTRSLSLRRSGNRLPSGFHAAGSEAPLAGTEPIGPSAAVGKPDVDLGVVR